jgi:hypothetical protein
MFAKFVCLNLAILFLAIAAFSDAAQETKKRGGTVVGKLEARKDSKDGKNSTIDVLAPGEEKARPYFVNFDPKRNAPIESVLKAVRAAKIGEMVELEWVDTNHGPAIQAFRVFKKSAEKGK